MVLGPKGKISRLRPRQCRIHCIIIAAIIEWLADKSIRSPSAWMDLLMTGRGDQRGCMLAQLMTVNDMESHGGKCR